LWQPANSRYDPTSLVDALPACAAYPVPSARFSHPRQATAVGAELARVKWDGWHCPIIKDADGIRIHTRKGNDWT
jgi:ATP-dependent DNA ligase